MTDLLLRVVLAAGALACAANCRDARRRGSPYIAALWAATAVGCALDVVFLRW